MYSPTPFGAMLKQLREEVGMSQGELADELGKTAQYISNIEKGKNNSPPDDASVVKLAEKLGLSGEDAERFRLYAYADRGMLPPELFNYIFERPALIALIRRAMAEGIDENAWTAMNFNYNERA